MAPFCIHRPFIAFGKKTWPTSQTTTLANTTKIVCGCGAKDCPDAKS